MLNIDELKFDEKGLIPAIVVDAGLAASIFHFGEVAINDLKAEMKRNGIPARIV